jgi:hypothetical protein
VSKTASTSACQNAKSRLIKQNKPAEEPVDTKNKPAEEPVDEKNKQAQQPVDPKNKPAQEPACGSSFWL